MTHEPSLNDKEFELSGEYHADCNSLMEEIKKLKNTLRKIQPEMEARVKGLQELWPGHDVLNVLRKNESIIAEIKNHLNR